MMLMSEVFAIRKLSMQDHENNEKTKLESIAGHPTTGPILSAAATLGTTVLSGFGVPFLGVIPGLVGSLAMGRMENRLNNEFKKLNQDLNALEGKMLAASDQQIAFLLGAVSSMFSTVDAAKLEILRTAAREAIRDESKVEGDAAMLARTIQNLSAPEVGFLVKNFGKNLLMADTPSGPNDNPKSANMIDPFSKDGQLITGLSSQGLILITKVGWSGQNITWTPLAKNILNLITSSNDTV